MENRIIGEKMCPTCLGHGKLQVWLAPPPCSPECAKDLRAYPQSDGMYWLCDKHKGQIPTLWRDHEKEKCLSEIAYFKDKSFRLPR